MTHQIYWSVSGEGRRYKGKGLPHIDTYYDYALGPQAMGIIPRPDPVNGSLQFGGIPQFYNPAYSRDRWAEVRSAYPADGVAVMIDEESVREWRDAKTLWPNVYRASLDYAMGDEARAERQYTESRKRLYLDLLEMCREIGVKNYGYFDVPWLHVPRADNEWLYEKCTAFFPKFYDQREKIDIKDRIRKTREIAGNSRPVYAVLELPNQTAEEIVSLALAGDCDVCLWGAAWKEEHNVESQWATAVRASEMLTRRTRTSPKKTGVRKG